MEFIEQDDLAFANKRSTSRIIFSFILYCVREYSIECAFMDNCCCRATQLLNVCVYFKPLCTIT